MNDINTKPGAAPQPSEFEFVIMRIFGRSRTRITVRWVPYEATGRARDVFEQGKDSMQAGWTGTFDRLDDYLAKACRFYLWSMQ